MTKRKVRLAVVASHPIQYHAFRWRALSALPDLDVNVLYCKLKFIMFHVMWSQYN